MTNILFELNKYMSKHGIEMVQLGKISDIPLLSKLPYI